MDQTTERNSILFVDDEEAILKSLRRLFMDEEWEMHFAISGADGLEFLKENHVNLIVSDVRMPRMDGIEFLNEVKKLYPDIVRVFLSGYADKQSVLRAFSEGSAQQLLPKPWDEAELKNVIHGALRQSYQQKKKFQGLQKIINSLSSLPKMPQTYIKVKKYLSDPEGFSIGTVSDFLEKDPALSAELIRWANSAFFGQIQKVDNLRRALVVLGSEIAEGLIISNSVFRYLENVAGPVPGFDHQAFHVHSMACGILAKNLMEHAGFPDEILPDRAFTAGLVHDIGKLVEESFFNQQFRQAIDLANKENQTISWAEKEVLGTTHEEIGSHLAEWWNMPSFLVNAVRWHHAPGHCSSDREIIAAVHVADALALKFNAGESGNSQLRDVDEECAELFDLSEARQEEMREILSQANN